MKRRAAGSLVVGCWLLMAISPVIAEDAPGVGPDNAEAAKADASADNAQTMNEMTGRRHVLIIVGLPGDAQHAQRFGETVQVWRQWLQSALAVRSDDVMVLSGVTADNEELRSTAANIRGRVQRLVEEIGEEDAFWLFLLGHGSSDRRQTWFHLPGPDLHAGEWAGLFNELKAREQVFWLTQSASGGFLKPMSRPGRVVITATDSAQEENETRFPHELAALLQTTMQPPASDPQQAAPPVDGSSGSVAELFRRVSEQVEQSFVSEQLVPTEHAQLDDNGDGVGTEADQLVGASDGAASDAPPAVPLDGAIAAEIRIPMNVIPQVTPHDDPPDPLEKSSDEPTDDNR